MQPLAIPWIAGEAGTVVQPYHTLLGAKTGKVLRQFALRDGARIRVGPVRAESARHVGLGITGLHQVGEPLGARGPGVLGNEHQKFAGGKGGQLVARAPMTKVCRRNGFAAHTARAHQLDRAIGRAGIHHDHFKRPWRALGLYSRQDIAQQSTPVLHRYQHGSAHWGHFRGQRGSSLEGVDSSPEPPWAAHEDRLWRIRKN